MTVHMFRQVDVFANGGFTGNPLAVVHDADDVSTDAMQTVTRWTNLSEAAFLLQPTDARADYRVRIFEPKTELPFAGHPTLGACAAWLDAGGVPQRPGVVVQECGAGLIEIRLDDGGGAASLDAGGDGDDGGDVGVGDGDDGRSLAFLAPPMIRHEPVARHDLDRAMRLLGLGADDVVASHWIDNGPGWMGLQLVDAQRVLDISAPTEPAQHFDVGVVGIHPQGSAAAIEVRAFFNDTNGSIREDPVTGSLNASIAQWLLGTGTLTAPYAARQTSGLVEISAADGQVWVGGQATVRVSGSIDI